jgi:hypothetical protein
MDPLPSLLEKIQAPLLLASSDGYERLSLVKNIEKTMTSLAEKLRLGIQHFPFPVQMRIS